MRFKTLGKFTILLAALAIAVATPACSKKDDEKKKDEHKDHSH
jgi:hypothetical protein